MTPHPAGTDVPGMSIMAFSRLALASAISRRGVLTGASATALLGAWGSRFTAAGEFREYRLRAAPGLAHLRGAEGAPTQVWAYDGTVPGPELRLKLGERLRVVFENGLPEEATTVHWHGLRIPNAMDGVPHMTQAAVRPGESFVYEFTPPDAGTFWYHPHERSVIQVGRGLFGPLIVEEPEPPRVDRDVTWVLNDWRLDPNGSIRSDFLSFNDRFNEGRLGDLSTVNGRIGGPFAVRAGERIRLRLINAAVARIFELAFEGHHPKIIALDGQPVAPHDPEDERVVIAPSQRVDLIVDMTGKPGETFKVRDKFYEGAQAQDLLSITYRDDPPLRTAPPGDPIAITDNALPEPDLAQAERLDVTFGGGGMANGVMWGEMAGGTDWSINGVALFEHSAEPLFTLRRGRSYVLRMNNKTGFHHPIHLHGHSFRVIARGGKPTEHQEWRDSVVMAPVERVDIAFVADNPGDWMFHCHILDHQAFGMMTMFRVA